jgi:hypothetical protein
MILARVDAADRRRAGPTDEALTLEAARDADGSAGADGRRRNVDGNWRKDADGRVAGFAAALPLRIGTYFPNTPRP